MKSIALTGHRRIPEKFPRKLLCDTLEGLIKEGCRSFFCGMAEGFDMISLEYLLSVKEKYGLYLEACVPYAGQNERYSAEEREKYERLIVGCDKKTVLFESYRSGCYFVRDRYMVDCADGVVAYLVKNTGGTAYTVRYALEKGKSVFYIR